MKRGLYIFKVFLIIVAANYSAFAQKNISSNTQEAIGANINNCRESSDFGKTESNESKYPELNEYFESESYQSLPVDSVYYPIITNVSLTDKRVAHLLDNRGAPINPMADFCLLNRYKDGGDVVQHSKKIVPDNIDFVEIDGNVHYKLYFVSSRLTEFLPTEIIDYKNYPGFILLEIMPDINEMADSYRKNGADSVVVFGSNSFRVYKKYEDINSQDNVDISRDDYPGFFGIAIAENGLYLPLKMRYPAENLEFRQYRTTNSRHFKNGELENEALFSIRPTSYPILPETHCSINVQDLSAEQRLKLKWVDLPACFPTPSVKPGKSVYLTHFDETMYGHSVYCTNDASNPYVWINEPSDGNIYSTVGSLEDDDFWSGDEHNYNRIHDKFDLSSIQDNSDVTAAQYETFLPDHEPYVTGDCDGSYDWTEVKPEVKNMVNNMLPAHNTKNAGNGLKWENDTYTDYWYDDVENGTVYYVASTWDWDKDMGYTGYDVDYNAAGLTHIESCINGVNWHIVGMSDYDEHNQSPTYWQAVANYNYYSNFRVYYIPCCMAPTSLTAHVNGSESTTVCPGSSITLSMDSFDGGGCACGSWQYAWTDGANWWNGSSFGNGTPDYNSAYNSISTSISSNTTYTLRMKCSSCSDYFSDNVSVNMYSESNAATSISGTSNICPGGSVNLSVSGGSLGTGANWEWYSGSCGGTHIGSGTSITTNPASSTTYYVRAEGTCNTTTCVSKTVVLSTNSTAVSSASASPAVINSGASSTLSFTGGSLGTGATWHWYTGSCGGTHVGTGTSISVSPTLNTTYYVRAEGTCNTTECIPVTVFVSGTVTICNGDNMDLSTVGGTLGAGASWKWYSGSCAGTYVGTGSPINVAPTSNITYYVRGEGTCNTTGCAVLTVIVNEVSIAATSISGTSNICSGGNSTLSLNGGSLGTDATWNWYSGSCGGTFVGSGTSINVSPLATTTYYVRAEGPCNTTSCPSGFTVNVLPDPDISITSSHSLVCEGATVSFTKSSSGGTGTVLDQWQTSTDGTNWSNWTTAANPNYVITVPTFFRCVRSATGNGCGTATSNVEFVDVVPDPVIDTEPISPSSICMGGTSDNMIIQVSGGTGSFSYQWQYYNGSSWNNVVNGTPAGSTYSGATGTTFSVSGISNSGDYDYRCVITQNGNGCSSLISSTATVSVEPNPTISVAGFTELVCDGGTVTMIGTASSSSSGQAYQWQSSPTGTGSWTNIAGATSLAYTTPPIASTTYYRVVLNVLGLGCGSATSGNNTVNVNLDPSVSLDPVGSTECIGIAHNMNIAASGGIGAYSYQWQYDDGGTWTNITGANSSSYSAIPSVTTDYRCLVATSGEGCDIANSATATVNIDAPTNIGVVSNDYVWSGNTSTDWETASNWLTFDGTYYSVASVIPDNTKNVFLRAYAPCATNLAATTASASVSCKDITIETGFTLGNISQINVSGDWNNSGTFNSGTGSVAFVGSSKQFIYTGGDSFNDVIFNNSNATNSDVEIASPMTVNGLSTFTNGIVDFSGSGSLLLPSSATTNGGSNNSFVNGPVTRAGNGAFTIPVGDVISRDIGAGSIEYAVWGPIGINPVANTTTTVEYFFTNSGLPDWWEHSGNLDATIHHVTDREYWLVNSTVNFANVTLHWKNNNHANGAVCVHSLCTGDNVYTASDMTVAYWSSTIWRDAGGSAVGSHDNGSITSGLQIPFGAKSNRIITFASKNNINPLPVELTSFDAECYDGAAIVEWQTVSETNNDYFILEKSNGKEVFYEVARLQGAGNSNEIVNYEFLDKSLFDGDNYYRLKQIDFDGKETKFEVISINCDNQMSQEPVMHAYPSPFTNDLNVVIDNLQEGEFVLEILDDLGRVVYSENCISNGIQYKTVLKLDDLRPAVYHLRSKSDKHVINMKVIKK